MKKRLNRAASWLLAAALVLTTLTGLPPALAVELASAAGQEDICLTAQTPAEFYTLASIQMEARSESFSLIYQGDDTLPDAPDQLDIDEIAAEIYRIREGVDVHGGDYLRFSGTEITLFQLGDVYHFYVSYFTDAEQEAWVDGTCESILYGLNVSDASDYAKVKAVYEYICTHFTYDDTLSRFTAYEGLTTGSMVCQGYSLLMYKLLWMLDVPCRIVIGNSDFNQNDQYDHGWNLVCVDGVWYHVDATWDAAEMLGGEMTWNYFLKIDEDFEGHTRGAEYDTPEFHASYPMAEESYQLHRLSILIDGSEAGYLTIRTGREVQLSALADPAADIQVRWVCTDQDSISLTRDGLLTSLQPGTAEVRVYPSDQTYLPAVLYVTAVDLSTCSDWASEELNAYYLRNLIPVELLCDYQSTITRSEFAQLLYTFTAYNANVLDYLLGKKLVTFVDVPEEHPAYTEICLGATMELFHGTGGDAFSPDDSLTREQAAVMICNAMSIINSTPLTGDGVLDYADAASISDWAVESVDALSDCGIFVGADGCALPQGSLTREQAMVLLERCLGLVEEVFFQPAE